MISCVRQQLYKKFEHLLGRLAQSDLSRVSTGLEWDDHDHDQWQALTTVELKPVSCVNFGCQRSLP